MYINIKAKSQLHTGVWTLSFIHTYRSVNTQLEVTLAEDRKRTKCPAPSRALEVFIKATQQEREIRAIKTEWKWKLLSCVRLFATPWTAARQAPLSIGILQARIPEWVPMPSSRDLPNPGIEPRSTTVQADSFTIWAIREAWAKAWGYISWQTGQFK